MGKLLSKFVDNIRGHKEWWADYMTEMSIMVISLAATFYGERVISDYMDAQDDKETIQIVIDEMHENIKELNELKEHYNKHIQYSNVLRRYLVNKETISSDSLELYFNYYNQGFICYYKENAFNMMKNSGTMLRMEDKQLLSQLHEAYDRMCLVKEKDVYMENMATNASFRFLSQLDDNEDTSTTSKEWDCIEKNREFKHFLLTIYPAMCRSRKYIITFTVTKMQETVTQLEQKIQ